MVDTRTSVRNERPRAAECDAGISTVRGESGDAFNIRRGGPAAGDPDVEVGHAVRSGLKVAVPDADPLAARFALLRTGYTAPVRLTLAATGTAAQTLARWRAAVAR